MNTKRILFTGARAPVVAYMAQICHEAGYEVYAADSTYASVCLFSRFVRKFIKLPNPSSGGYAAFLCETVRKHQIDFLVPTCEEIFYMARFKQMLEKYTRVLCDRQDKLLSLHDKWAFYRYLRRAGLPAPNTRRADQSDNKWPVKKVIKPRFSRFASKVNIARTLPQNKADKRYIVQDFINGRQICSYALAEQGKIISQCVYEPVLTAGKGAGILLERICHPLAEEITAHISRDFNFTGQIAFDFMETPSKELYVIECNPRATNGLGFIGADLIRWLSKSAVGARNGPSALVSRLAVGSYAWKQPLKTIRAQKRCRTAQDFVSFKKDPSAWLAQIPVVAWWILKGVFHGGPTSASTADIEFNGEEFL